MRSINRADWYVRKVLDQAQAYRAAAPAAGGWVVPVDGRCSSGFGVRGGEFHAGQDLAAATGTPIVAAASGTVIDSGPANGYGLWVRIQHPDGVVSTYGHNRRNLSESQCNGGPGGEIAGWSPPGRVEKVRDLQASEKGGVASQVLTPHRPRIREWMSGRCE